MGIIKLPQKKEPVALIVYAPSKELLEQDPVKIQRTMRTLEQAVKNEMIPFVENPQQVLVHENHLTAKEREVRREYLEALGNNFVSLLVLAGASISEYVREVIFLACQGDTDISLYADDDSVLARYVHMQQSGKIRR